MSTATNGRVTSLLKDLPSAFAAHMADPSRPVPILVASVLHFTGHWAPSNEFNPARTTRDTFKLARGTTSGCYMMRALVSGRVCLTWRVLRAPPPLLSRPLTAAASVRGRAISGMYGAPTSKP